MLTAIIITAITALAATIWLTGVYRNAALTRGLLDNPDHRSSHTVPTPTGGGIVAVVAIMAIWLVCYFLGLITLKEKIALIVPGAIIALVGFLDDRHNLPRRWRFLAQIASVAMVIALLYPLPELQIWGELSLNLNTSALPLVGLGMVWLINLYNFMDGIDGLAGGEAVTVLAGAAIIVGLAGNWPLSVLMLLTSVPIYGFLYWNWPPAKIFMGDACSTFLGLSFGTLALITAKTGDISLWAWVILLAVFIVDATYTLLVRIFTGQDWRAPHRSHLYQRLASKYDSHKLTSVLLISYTCFYLLPISLAKNKLLLTTSVSLMLAILPIVTLSIIAKSGRAEY